MTTDLVTLGVEVQTKGAAQSAQQLGQFTTAAKGAAGASDTLDDQIRELVSRLSSLAKEEQKAAAETNRLAAEQRKAAADAKKLADEQARASSTAGSMGGAMQGIGTAFKNNSSSIQNAGFQISDLIVQMEMGVPASRALGQQLPQLLGGFGPLGAVVGVATGALLTLAPALFGASEETGKLDEAIQDLSASTDELILKADALRLGVDEEQVLIFQRLNELLVERSELETRLQAGGGQQVAASVLLQSVNAEIAATELLIEKSNDAKRQLEELEAPKKGADKLAMLEAENALMRVQVEFGKESTEFALARAEAELKAFEATLSTANEASGLNDKLRAAFIEGQNLSSLDIASGLGSAANEASRMADELARAASNAISAAANANRARREAEIRLKFAGDPAGQAGAMFDLQSGILQGSQDMGVRMQFEALRQETVDNAAATAEAQAALASFNQTMRSSGTAAAKVDQEVAKLTETFDPFQKVVEGVAGTIESELNSAFASVLDGTKTLGEALLDFASNVLAQVAKDLFAQQFSKPIAAGIAGIFSEKGNVFNSAGVTPFANGGVVSGPTIFPFANGVGLMGEAGPEAIMPLARGADGKLGVSAANGNSAPNVIINNYSGQEATASSDSAGNLVVEIGRAIAQDITSGGPSYRAIRTTFGLGNRLQQRG